MLRDRSVLVALLDAAGISERELARRARLGHATVNHLMTGRRGSCSPATARAVCAALGVDVRVLFSGVGLAGRERKG